MSICPVDNPLADARELSLRTGAQTLSLTCITIHRYPAFSTRYSVMCKVYTRYRYHGTSETEHGFSSLWSIIHSLVLVRYLSEQAHKIYVSLVPQSTDIQSLARDTVNNPSLKHGDYLRTRAQIMLYFSHSILTCSKFIKALKYTG